MRLTIIFELLKIIFVCIVFLCFFLCCKTTCSRIRLSHSILLELNVASQTAYARFAAAISILQDMNQDMEIQTNSYDNISYDEYNIISSALAPAILGTVKTMQEHFKDGTFTDPDYQLEYKDDLRQFNIPIEDAIHIS